MADHSRGGRPTRLAVAGLVALLVAVVVVVVVLDRREARAGTPVAELADLSGQAYVVGGKNNFEEQDLLCRITVAVLQAARATVTDRCATGSTATTRQALLDGRIDVYWEYTGTAWTTFLGQAERIADATQLYDLVRDRDRRAHGVVWTARADVDNTYAFAMNGERAAQLTIGSISDMARHLASGAPGTMCVEREYRQRPDGLGNLQRAYGFTVPPQRLRVLPAGDVYQATARGDCLFGEVYSTDGRIPGLALQVLRDDRGYHQIYDPAPTMRADTFDRDPAVARVLDAVAQRLDQPTMLALNGQVSSDGRDPRDVAEQWLADTGLVPSGR